MMAQRRDASPQEAVARPAVLFTSLHGTAGGSDRALETLLAHLDGIQRIVATPNLGLANRLLGEAAVQDVMRLPRARSSMFARSAMITGLFAAVWRQRRYIDVIHANGVFDFALAWPAAFAARIPVVVWSHKPGAVPRATRLGAKAGARILRDVRWFACSPLAREELVRARLASPQSIDVISNPIDPLRVSGGADAHRGVNVAFLGDASSRKGFDLLPDVITALDDVEVHWIVYSNRRPNSDMDDVWRDVVGRSNVEIVGKVDDVRDAYARCDIVFCPSRSESFGRVAAEAMMNRIPVVASSIPAFEATVGHGDAGLLFREGDPSAAAAALRRLIDDLPLRERLGSKGKIRAQTYEPEAIAARFREVYASAAG